MRRSSPGAGREPCRDFSALRPVTTEESISAKPEKRETVAMRLMALLFAVLPLCAQDGQQSGRPGWPCVPGRAVDPAYLETSESTGGQLFLFQKGEVAQSGPVMSAGYSHPATVARAIGQLSGTRDIDFPVD